MSRDTESELLFASYCRTYGLDFKRIAVGPKPTPDYRFSAGGVEVFVEIKQIESTRGLNPNGVSSRTVGNHVRSMISEARKQIQAAAREDHPSILLIYNKVDEPFQSFGTESHDFIAAMYGELTVRLVDGRASGSYQGRNAKLHPEKNTSFSAVGHLRRTEVGADVTIYENVYAKWPLPYASLPNCIEVVRVEVENAK
ncbi:MAG: hypothetical protein Q8R67_03250 [Rhodoferax sp.]|nr:hypothetical protein [Rhodoferax sp.]MDP3650679.1 hypothetical protein [Rhodoferax sp.]